MYEKTFQKWSNNDVKMKKNLQKIDAKKVSIFGLTARICREPLVSSKTVQNQQDT